MKQSIRTVMGAHFLLALFVSTTLLTSLFMVIQAQPVKAWDRAGGSGVWYNPNTILFTDDNGEKLEFHLDPTYPNGQLQGRKGGLALSGVQMDGDDPGNPNVHKNFTYFLGPTYNEYQNKVGLNNSSGDGTGFCLPAAADHDGVALGVIGIDNRRSDKVIVQVDGFGNGLLNTCAMSGWQNVAIGPRPDFPSPLPGDDQGSVSWVNPYNIMTYKKGSLDLSQDGITDGQEFDVSAVDGNSMTLSSTSTTLNADCKGMSSQLVVNPYNPPLSDPYAQFPYAHLFVPKIPPGQIGDACAEVPRAWLKIHGNYKIPDNLDKNSSATWVSSNTIQINTAHTSGTADTSGATEFQGDGISNGDVFTQTSLSGQDMHLVAPNAAPGCKQKTTMEVNPYLGAQYVLLTLYGLSSSGTSGNPQACGPQGTIWLPLTNTGFQAGIDFGSSTDQSAGNNGPNCPSTGTLLDWALCPMYDVAKGAVQMLSDQIQSVLFINTDQLFGTPDQPSGFLNSYNVFRNFGLTLLVLAGLVMVISQAAGLDMFSAYTIRKALPRIVIAAIGMALAWPILQFVITFFNDLGSWINSIIMLAAPVGASGVGSSNPIESVTGNVLAIIAGVGIVGGIFFTLGIFGALSLMLSAAIGLLLGYATLVIREVVIIMCVLLAPLAIAASILPGTEKLWKFWRETLLGALMMFPIVMGFLSAGVLLSAVTGVAAQRAAATGAGGLNVLTLAIISIIAYFAPYFMIPMAFRMASGLMSNIFGVVNDRGKGIFDRLRKKRQEIRAQRNQAWRAGSLYPNRGLGTMINNAGRHVNAGWRGNFGFGETGRTALALDSAAEVERTLKGNPRLMQLANDDDANAVLGLSGGTRAGAVLAARRLFGAGARADRAVAAASAIGFNRANATAALTTMAQNKSRAVGAGDIGAVQEGINRLAGGNAAMANSLAFGYQFNSRQAGRFDLGGAWHTGGVQATAEDMRRRAVAAGGPAADQDIARAVSMATMLDGFDRTELSQVMRGHTNEIRAGLDSIDYALQYGSPDQQITAAHHILELQSGLPYAVEGNKEEINRWMESRGFRVGESRPSLAQQVADSLMARGITTSTTRPGYAGANRDTIARTLDAEARVYGQEAYRQGAGGGPLAP